MIDQTESLKLNKHNSSSKRQGSIPAAASSKLSTGSHKNPAMDQLHRVCFTAAASEIE
jgi:hypothetical protein